MGTIFCLEHINYNFLREEQKGMLYCISNVKYFASLLDTKSYVTKRSHQVTYKIKYANA